MDKIDKSKFEKIKKEYGHYASWAIWSEEGRKPKDNVGDLSIFKTKNINSLIKKLKPNIILVGLNISRKTEYSFGNFHDSSSRAMDYKIRYALKDTPYWGAYMTDIIKDFEQKSIGENDGLFKEEQ